MNLDAGERQRSPRRKEDGADSQNPAGRPRPQQKRGQGTRAGQQRYDEAADEMVSQAEKTRGDRGPERQVQPAERPAGNDDRNEGKHVRTKTGGNAE